MRIDIQPHSTEPKINLVRLVGRLDAQTSPAASPPVLKAVESCGIGVIFDLAGLDFVSSAGLRLLLLAYKECEANGKKLAMIRAQPSVYKIFKLAAFDEPFNFQPDEASAITSIKCKQD